MRHLGIHPLLSCLASDELFTAGSKFTLCVFRGSILFQQSVFCMSQIIALSLMAGFCLLEQFLRFKFFIFNLLRAFCQLFCFCSGLCLALCQLCLAAICLSLSCLPVCALSINCQQSGICALNFLCEGGFGLKRICQLLFLFSRASHRLFCLYLKRRNIAYLGNTGLSLLQVVTRRCG